MTRKDYELIASAISRTRMASRVGVKATIKGRAQVDAKKAALDLVTIDLAATLANDNERFDRRRFYDAAGFEGNSWD
jgi:hypothetical protein